MRAIGKRQHRGCGRKICIIRERSITDDYANPASGHFRHNSFTAPRGSAPFSSLNLTSQFMLHGDLVRSGTNGRAK
jgi:hypothetical protein